MFNTRICELLNIKYPIIQGGMAWVATAELAAAVSNAGGLGIIGAGSAPAEVVKGEIKKAKALTDKPFGVNVYFMSPFVDEIMNLVIEENVQVITTGAGNPGKYIPRLKEAGIKVMPVVSSVALARRLEKTGVDALVVEGMECGGHIGDLTTMVSVPQVVDAVSIPVIAAGGIADARGFVAALALGAEGVQMGTRFVCSTECTAHPKFKEAIVKAKDRSTTVTGKTTGHPVRVLKNKLTNRFEEMESNLAPVEELEELGSGKLRLAVIEGDVENGSVMAGQIAGLISDIKPVAEIIQEIITNAEELIKKLQDYVV
ncbi:2-nitropropane dioxygenase [Tepidanaerobacter syntrophicus]|uniref:Probable nitronate monooxygenase n=1 Tax=Tepidanaerobacter syntrophicus TaxID=224999 RepID=A0A0U9HHV8_9FIRM|nr:enoyl-[acyl-carrier-protein] reductase FabK [Tepidanaerobacter syntrophicus]GAQ26298.1 enoyl-[acyl-carrier protein] reductase II [Tepidanaerobacter syntrophicus]GLI19286.1 2-nitropropane dioxygenase [Tepidanaerobacter syntrophicus]GLI50080.1 2-nitropropane dioxygenase [Tepidanaerobacter syntrophicus]HHV84178.1 enoyl-[acyl-carrier-protein] reductase FabK [Tepidanaerobacter syntrophicus]